MTQMYHVGLNPDAPYDVIHLAGVEIPKRTERVSGYGAATKREPIQGVYLTLSDEKREAILAAASGKVFRTIGKTKKGARTVIVSKSGTGFERNGKCRNPYKPQEEDMEVGRFVYMNPANANPLQGEVKYESVLGGAPPAMPVSQRSDDDDEPRRGRKGR